VPAARRVVAERFSRAGMVAGHDAAYAQAVERVRIASPGRA
jgi:hypothetical protein